MGIQQGIGIPLDDENKHPATYKGGKLLLSTTSCYNPNKWYDKKCSECRFNIDCCYPKKRGGIKYKQWSDGTWHLASEEEPSIVVRQPVVRRSPVSAPVVRTPMPSRAPVLMRTPIKR